MQRELGPYGIMAKYKPPGANYAIWEYPIVVNALPVLRDALENDMPFLIRPGRHAQPVLMMVPRRRAPDPPFLPVFVLHWAGLAPVSATTRVADSLVLRIISGVFVQFCCCVCVGFIGNGLDTVPGHP